MGSPPEKCTCRTPSAAASCSTRRHSSSASSPAARSSSTGFEQYGQRSGQRWVSSASSANGGSMGEGSIGEVIGETPFVREVLQHGGDVAGDKLACRLRVTRGENVDDGVDARLAVDKFQYLDRLLVRQHQPFGRH